MRRIHDLESKNYDKIVVTSHHDGAHVLNHATRVLTSAKFRNCYLSHENFLSC